MSENGLPAIHNYNDRQLVNARELHHFLESKREFATWIKDRIEKYGFIENEDYTSFDKIVKRENGATTRIEYGLTLEMAKELAMVENNEKGRTARRYFIECERKAKLAAAQPVQLPTMEEMAAHILSQHAKTKELSAHIEKQNAEIKRLLPKAELMEKVLDADERIDIGQACKILELPYGRNTFFKELRERGIFFKERNEPKQEYVKRGYFVMKEKWIDRNQHDSFCVIKVLVTQKGLAWLAEQFEVLPSSKKQAGME